MPLGGAMSRAKSAENKKKPARVAAGPEAPGFARSMGENTGRVLRPLIPLTIFLAVFAGLSFALWYPVRGEGSANNSRTATPSERGRLSAGMLQNAILKQKRPPYISAEDFRQVANLGLAFENRSIFEPNLTRTLAQRYESSPWVERVQAIRVRYPALIEVELDWRVPAARVENSTMVLDPHGVVLNLMSDNPALQLEIPKIAGVICARTDAGRKVSEKDLLDGLGLLGVLNDALSSWRGKLKVAAVQREPSGQWLATTDRGPRILWGFFTEEPPIDEPRTQEKANLLRRRLSEVNPSDIESIRLYDPRAPMVPRSQPVGNAREQAPGRPGRR